MSDVMTLRMPEEDLKAINKISKSTKKDKSTIVRELVEMGRIYLAIKEYREGKTSMGKAAEIANLTISEIIDLFSELGIKSNVELEDYLEGQSLAEEIM